MVIRKENRGRPVVRVGFESIDVVSLRVRGDNFLVKKYVFSLML